MDFVPSTTEIKLEAGDAALVFRRGSVHVFVANGNDNLEGSEPLPASQPMQMVAIVATILTKDNRDLWLLLRERFNVTLQVTGEPEPPQS